MIRLSDLWVLTGYTYGTWRQIASVTMPPLAHWCERHGYTLTTGVDMLEHSQGRPASWGKVPAMMEVLARTMGTTVLWVDADVLIMPDAPAFPELGKKLQALVIHQVPEGEGPNCGVWAVSPCGSGILRQVWDRIAYVDSPWYENAALMDVMGSPPVVPIRYNRQAALARRTLELDPRWNVLPTQAGPAFARHAAGVPLSERASVLYGWAEAYRHR
jgi:hypothetical protein